MSFSSIYQFRGVKKRKQVQVKAIVRQFVEYQQVNYSPTYAASEDVLSGQATGLTRSVYF